MPNGPSPTGAAGVRALQTAGGDWQTKRPNVNTTSRQQGEFQRVITQQDGWVSCGKVERSSLPGLQYIEPSWLLTGGTDGTKNRRGLNEFSGLSIETSQLRAIQENPIAYLCAGLTHKLEYDGEMMEDSTTTAVLKLKQSYLSYGSGKTVAQILANGLPDYIPGAKSDKKWYGGIAHDMLTSEFSMGYYTGFEVGGNAWRVSLPAKPLGSLVPMTRRPTIHRLTPNSLLGFVPGFQSMASGPRGSQIVFTSDNGRTWFYAFDESTLLTDRHGYDAGDPEAWVSDAQVFEVRDRFLATRMIDGSVVAIVGEGAYTTTAVANQLRVYALDSGASTLIQKEMPIGPAGQYSTAYKHGGHHHDRPFMQFVRDSSGTAYLWFLKLDASGGDHVAMPQPSRWTGRARALDRGTIQCPMYYAATGDDPAGYYICTTDDFGATWKKTHLIKEDGNAPPVISVFGDQVNHTLQAFADAFLPRKNGFAADTYPGAPWIGDSYRDLPWME